MSLSRALYSVNENDDAALASALGKSSMPCNAFGRTCSPPPPKPPPPPPSPPSPPPPSPPPPSPPQEWPLQIVTTIANDGEVTEEYENLSAALPVKFITKLYKDGSSTREIVDTNISPPPPPPVYQALSDSTYFSAITACLATNPVDGLCTNSVYGPMPDWDVSNVKIMGGWGKGFSSKSDFNADISKWDVSSVTTMLAMFNSATSFNADISGWDTGKVNSMLYMFSRACAFNADITGWDTSSLTNTGGMFDSTNCGTGRKFNYDIGKWDMSKVTNMAYMFWKNEVFNQDISGWKGIGATTSQTGFNSGATAFNAKFTCTSTTTGPASSCVAKSSTTTASSSSLLGSTTTSITDTVVSTVSLSGQVTQEIENQQSSEYPTKFLTKLYKNGTSTQEKIADSSSRAQASLGTNLLASRSSFDSLFPQVACVVLVAFVALFAYRRNKASSAAAMEESDKNNESLLKRRMTYGAVNKA